MWYEVEKDKFVNLNNLYYIKLKVKEIVFMSNGINYDAKEFNTEDEAKQEFERIIKNSI